MNIYKYPLNIRSDINEMPRGATIIHVAAQNDAPTAWAIVDPNAPLVKRKLSVLGTGAAIGDAAGSYIGTCFCGPYVWHVFDFGEV